MHPIRFFLLLMSVLIAVTTIKTVAGQEQNLSTRNRKVIVTIEPARGFHSSTKAFGNIPIDLHDYYEAPTIAAYQQPQEIIYDAVARPSVATQVIDTINGVIGLAGAAKRISTPDTMGPLDDKDTTHYVFDTFQGAYRLRVLADKTFGLLVFRPLTDSTGRFRNPDPLHISNWKFLNRDEAIDRLQSSMSYQAQLHKSVDPSFSQVFLKTSGLTWQPQFAYLNPPHDARLSQILKWPSDTVVKLNHNGRVFDTTIHSFLHDNILPYRNVPPVPIRHYWVTEFLDQNGNTLNRPKSSNEVSSMTEMATMRPSKVVILVGPKKYTEIMKEKLPPGIIIKKEMPYATVQAALSEAAKLGADTVLGVKTIIGPPPNHSHYEPRNLSSSSTSGDSYDYTNSGHQIIIPPFALGRFSRDRAEKDLAYGSMSGKLQEPGIPKKDITVPAFGLFVSAPTINNTKPLVQANQFPTAGKAGWEGRTNHTPNSRFKPLPNAGDYALPKTPQLPVSDFKMPIFKANTVQPFRAPNIVK